MQRELARQNCAVCGSHSPSRLPRPVSTQNHGFSILQKSAFGEAFLEKPSSLKTLTNPVEDHAGSATAGPISVYAGHEFVIHNSCLFLLQKTSHPKYFLQRLYEVLASLPYSHSYQTVDWGHDYGMQDVASECGYDPWLVHLSSDPEHPLRPYSTFDPLRSPQVDKLLSESDMRRRKQGTREVPLIDNQLATAVHQMANSSDCFLRLPLEMCSLIAEYLPAADVANTRLASRAFRSVFDNQSFWASRFYYFHERSWFSEAVEAKNHLDWRNLYFSTRYVSIDKHLKNRRRIWELVSMISGSLELRWHGPLRRCGGLERIEHSLGAVISCTERSGYDNREGSRIYHLHQILVPARISQIGVSFTKLGDAKYVCGFTIWQLEGPPCHLGYESRDQQYVNLEGLTGIMVTNGKQGIQAIKFLTNKKTPWLGQRRGSAALSQLATGQQVKATEGVFDGCKMVSLAISGTDA